MLPLLPSSAETPTSTPAAKETVTVSGKKPAVQVLPDRTVYNLDNNIQSSTSSVSDVLRNLPSVDVDIDGNLTLRGDANVTVLIDGKKSPLVSGNLADALRAIPANTVERIEVITNPPAEYRAEGAAGVINIVLRKKVEPVSSGSLRVNVGSEGRFNASAFGSTKLGKVPLSVSYSESKNINKSDSSFVRSDGTALSSSLDFAMKTKMAFSMRMAMLFANYQANEANSFRLSGMYFRMGMHFNMAQRTSLLATETVTDSLLRLQTDSVQADLVYTHNFAAKGDVSLDLSHSTSWGRSSFDSTCFNAADAADYCQSQHSTTRGNNTELKADYTLPFGAYTLPTRDTFKAGYALRNEHSLDDAHGFLRDGAMADWTTDSATLFAFDRTIHAGYVSYEQKFGKFGVKGGLRLEHDIVNTELRTTGETHATTTTGLYPSLHLSYAIADTQQLTLAYTRRLDRPGAYALNPARHSSDAFNAWGGNPDLKSEQADSFETSYHDAGEKTDLIVTGYYRTTYKVITDVYRQLSDTVLLRTTDNLGRRMASGVEVNLNATLLSGLALRTSGGLAYNEFNPGALAIGKKQSGLGWTLKGGIDWQATPDDLVQFNAGYTGRQFFAQGYIKPTLNGDFGFKHKFGEQFAGVLSINNLFDSASRDTVLTTPGLNQTGHTSTPGPIFYVGLVYTFGGFNDTEGAQNGGGNQDMGVAVPSRSPGGGL